MEFLEGLPQQPRRAAGGFTERVSRPVAIQPHVDPPLNVRLDDEARCALERHSICMVDGRRPEHHRGGAAVDAQIPELLDIRSAQHQAECRRLVCVPRGAEGRCVGGLGQRETADPALARGRTEVLTGTEHGEAGH